MAKEDFLGAHSDPVETIGPWAIIASVTFGAARHFRMKPVAPISYTGEGGVWRRTGSECTKMVVWSWVSEP